MTVTNNVLIRFIGVPRVTKYFNSSMWVFPKRSVWVSRLINIKHTMQAFWVSLYLTYSATKAVSALDDVFTQLSLCSFAQV